MLNKNNKPQPKKKGEDAAEFDAQLEALLRDHKMAEWGKRQPTFLRDSRRHRTPIWRAARRAVLGATSRAKASKGV